MKETFYFSHDYNARNDRKLVGVMMKHGLQGIGAYWCIVEMLYEEGGKTMLSQCDRIAFELRTTYEIIHSVIHDFELFQNDEIFFWSDSIIERLGMRNQKSEKARINAEKRWKKQEGNAENMQSHSDRNAIKERKGKENKEKENKEKEIQVLTGTEKTPAQKAKEFFSLTPTEISERMSIAEEHQEGFKAEILKFQKYWLEMNKSGTKHKWELETTFEIPLRLSTWFSRAKKDFTSYQQKKGTVHL